MKKHAPHIRVPEGNHRGETSIHQDTKTMALVQYYQCEKHASPPGLEPGSLDYRKVIYHMKAEVALFLNNIITQ